MTCPLLPGFSTTATIVHLHPVCITGFGCGSFGFSASLSRRVFAMWPPFRVESVSVLDRDEGSSSAFLVFGWSLRDEVTLMGRVCLSSRSERRLCAPSLGVGAVPSRWGHPVLGRVAYFCALDRYDGFFYPSILRCFALGSPYGSTVVFSRLIAP